MAWQVVPDPEGSGDNYYWNDETGEVTWDMPAALVVTPPPLPSATEDQPAPGSHAGDVVSAEQPAGSPEAQTLEVLRNPRDWA